ncbi:hypothetical protein DBV05_g11844 [Lasiodiplodia theobromae]|uniref:Tyr recombinase domain-containing protein n=1 Tax=Lasiodiplodia theobromae TaxID=45133 RepID=A0A5N5CVY0_9PEZI|nr:hypothetical protein DBV05_g11844 [Lasiodiplodia theobromae]
MSQRHVAASLSANTTCSRTLIVKSLSAEELNRIEATFDETALTQRVYSSSSETLLKQVERLWLQYCTIRGLDHEVAIAEVDTRLLHNFFFWVLSYRKTTLRAKGTLETYWKVFCLVRERKVGYKLDKLVIRQMQGVLQRLVKDFGLQTKKREKVAMHVEDLFEVLKTLWTSTDMTFDHERHRTQLSLIMLLAGITGSRPGALLALRYRDVQVTLIRDPAGGQQPLVLIELTYEYTKGYLGAKDR